MHEMEGGSGNPIAFADTSSCWNNYSQLEKEGLAIISHLAAWETLQNLLGSLTTVLVVQQVEWSTGNGSTPNAMLGNNSEHLQVLDDLPPRQGPCKWRCSQPPASDLCVFSWWPAQGTSEYYIPWLQNKSGLGQKETLPCPESNARRLARSGSNWGSLKEKRRVECAKWMYSLGSRTIVPLPGCEAVINELHKTHHGMLKIKNLAHSYVWWPNMNAAKVELSS